MANKIWKQISHVDCHFKWKPEQHDGMTGDIRIFERKLVRNMEEDTRIEIFALTLLSYIFTIGDSRGKDIDFRKARKYADTARNKCKCKGEEFIAIANKMHIFEQTKKTKELERLYPEMKTCEEGLISSDHCRIKCIHAFALTRFGMKGYHMAVDIYKETLLIEKDNADCHFRLGMILGRIRRYKQSNHSKPCEEEMKALFAAYHLCEQRDALYVVRYAHAWAQCIVCENRNGSKTNVSDLEAVETAFNMAICLAESSKVGSGNVYKWTAKGFKRLCKIHLPDSVYKQYLQKQKECVDKAVAYDPNDTSILHEAGMFYWRVKQYRDLILAQEYLEKACRCSSDGNFWADVDLAKFRKNCNPSYDIIEDFTPLLTKYAEREDGMDSKLHIAYLHMMIGEELSKQGDDELAQKELLEAVELDRSTQRVREAKDQLILKLSDKLKKTDSLNGGGAVKMALLLDLGHVYYIIGRYTEAKPCYTDVLLLDDGNCTAIERLCEIYFLESRYDDCIQLVRDKWKMYPNTTPFVAKSLYEVAMLLKSSDFESAKENLYKSAELGLLESGETLLGYVREECENNEGLCLTQRVYEECSKIHHWFSHSEDRYFSIQECDIAAEASKISKGAYDLVTAPKGLSSIQYFPQEPFCKTRKLRFDMTKKKVSNFDQHIFIHIQRDDYFTVPYETVFGVCCDDTDIIVKLPYMLDRF